MTDQQPTATQKMREHYERRIASIDRLPELPMQAAKLRDSVTGLKPPVAALWLDQLIRGAIWGRETEMNVVLALAYWLIRRSRDDQHYDFLGAVYRIAHEHRMVAVLNLLRDPPPHRQMPEEAELPPVRLPLDRDEIPVGERRTMARRHDPDLIDRLTMDPDPRVIDVLLQNRDLQQRDVLRITARRPTDPAILRTVVGHIRWLSRPIVRKSLVINPYNATGISLKLMPTLGIHVLRKIRDVSEVHPALDEVAAYLVDLRESHTYPWEV